jgi:ABC-2 type transport system permease protein
MLEITTLGSTAEADQLVADGEAPAAVIIPAEFSNKIDVNEATKVLVITDPTQEEMADIVTAIVNQATAEIGILGELQYGIRAVLAQAGTLDGADPELRAAVEAQTLGVIWTQVQEMRQNPLISVRSEDLEGEETEASWNPVSYTIPAFAVMFAFFLVVFIAEQVLMEKESGSFRRLMASPISRGGIIGGKLLAYVIVVFAQVILLFTVGVVFFKIPLGNSPLGLFLITLATALAAVSLGLLVGALAKTSKQANQIGMVLGFILMGVGGCIFPFFKEEGFIGIVSRLTPHAHAVEAYMRLMIDGYGLLQVLTNLVILVGFASVFLVLAVWRFRFE